MRMKKGLFTLNVDNYAPEITRFTFPLMKAYAHKIGAEFYEIKERKFKEWPVVYEKLQIHQYAKEMKNDWNIYLDADALINPETPDFTVYLNKNTVAHNGKDFAGLRWRYDEYFMRDGRNIGSCNWCAIASDWCIDLWKPLDDLTLEQAIDNIYPTIAELSGGMEPDHLIDDYTLSRNIAKYGLKATTLMELLRQIGLPNFPAFHHLYNIPTEQKVEEYKKAYKAWGLGEPK